MSPQRQKKIAAVPTTKTCGRFEFNQPTTPRAFGTFGARHTNKAAGALRRLSTRALSDLAALVDLASIRLGIVVWALGASSGPPSLNKYATLQSKWGVGFTGASFWVGAHRFPCHAHPSTLNGQFLISLLAPILMVTHVYLRSKDDV